MASNARFQRSQQSRVIRPGPDAACLDGRPRPHGLGAGACRRHRAADRERSSGPHDGGRAPDRREAGPAPLSPSRHGGRGTLLESIMQVASELEPARNDWWCGRGMRRCAKPAPVTTIWPASSVLPWPTHWWRRDTRSWPAMRDRDRHGRGISRPHRNRYDGHARATRAEIRPGALPALPRLERAAAASGGDGRLGDLYPQLRHGMDQAQRRTRAVLTRPKVSGYFERNSGSSSRSSTPCHIARSTLPCAG